MLKLGGSAPQNPPKLSGVDESGVDEPDTTRSIPTLEPNACPYTFFTSHTFPEFFNFFF